MAIYLRHSYLIKPTRAMCGSDADVQASIFKNAERAGIDPRSIVSYFPLFWMTTIDYARLKPTTATDLSFDKDGYVFSNSEINYGSDAALNFSEQMTFFASIFPTSYPDTFQIVAGKYDGTSSDNDSWFFRHDKTTGRFFIRNTAGDAWHNADIALSITLNTWHDVAGTYDGAVVKCYVDKLSASANAVTTIRSNPTVDTIIGRLTGGGLNYSFRGKISEVMLCNTAWTSTQIAYKQDNPYFLLQPITPIFYSVPAAAGMAIPLISGGLVNNGILLHGSIIR